jgi:hypothetical protein
MPAQEYKYSPMYLGPKDTSIKAKWDNNLIMDWIEYQPNPFDAPEFYEPMAGHDPPQITLRREIREQLGDVWSPDRDFVHPLALDLFEHEEVSFNRLSKALDLGKLPRADGWLRRRQPQRQHLRRPRRLKLCLPPSERWALTMRV